MDNKRQDWHENHLKILNAHEILREKNIAEGKGFVEPSAKEISDFTGISLGTIYNHLENNDIANYKQYYAPKTVKYLGYLEKAAENGNYQAQIALIKLVTGADLSEKTKIEVNNVFASLHEAITTEPDAKADPTSAD